MKGRLLRSLILAALLAPIVVTAASSTNQGPRTYPLLRYTEPWSIAVAGDGSIWMSNDYGGLTRLRANGQTTPFLDSEDDYIRNVVRGPDGSVWAADDNFGAAHVALDGTVSKYSIGPHSWVDAVASSRDAVWVANAGVGGDLPRLERIGSDGATREFVDHVPRDWRGFNGLTASPDGSIWFTEFADRRAWIGHMTAAGAFMNIPLPRNFGEPGEIVATSDGSAWFTAYHALGRITVRGRITRYRLPFDLSPNDLALGDDGVPWFTSDLCLGRIDPSGAVTTWPVHGASQLGGIAPGGHGTFWLADRIGNVIRRVAPTRATAAPCGAQTLTRHAGRTRATLTFQVNDKFSGVEFFSDIRIRISRAGRTLLREVVQGDPREYSAHGDSTSLAVRDLDGDGEPEVTLLLNSSGAHCCSWSRIYRYDPQRNTYVGQTHWWGEGGSEPRLRDLNGDGRPEFLSVDDRFDEAFVNFAGSARPIQIWSYTRGTFNDVTRRYPELIRRDAAKWRRLYLKSRLGDARGILPAWIADEDMLGLGAVADRVLKTAFRRSYLKENGFGPPTARGYLRALTQLLHRTGYA